MDEEEFRRRLDLFPVVRPRDYHIDLDPSRQSTSRPPHNEKWHDSQEEQPLEGAEREIDNQTINTNDGFWEKLRVAAERKVGPAEAQRFCNAFQQVHRRLVFEELSLDAARSFVNSHKSSEQHSLLPSCMVFFSCFLCSYKIFDREKEKHCNLNFKWRKLIIVVSYLIS